MSEKLLLKSSFHEKLLIELPPNEKINKFRPIDTNIKSTTISSELKILTYYELIDNIREIIDQHPNDEFMNEKRLEVIDRFENRIYKILQKKSITKKIKDFIKNIFK